LTKGFSILAALSRLVLLLVEEIKMNKQTNGCKLRQRLMVLFLIVGLNLAVVWTAQTAVENTFVAYENNPVLELGTPGEWDGGTIVLPEVIVVSDTLHMFYTGLITAFDSAPTIGYASSPDGLTWTKNISNPILVSDGTGFDAYYVATPAMLDDNGLWVMYYAGQPTPPPAPSGSQIGRATAPAPTGPWTKGTEPVLTLGSSGEWDSGFIEANAVLKIDNEYVMYYSGGANFFDGVGFMIGRATSPDGLIWTKYDDPTTTEVPFAESDPVLTPGPAGAWDEAIVWESSVRHTPCGWEMYYTGAPSLLESAIGYATSDDGLVWVKDPANPIYEAADDPVTMMTGNIVEVPTVIDVGSERWIYYDYGQGTAAPAIGLAKAPLACRSVYLPLISQP
jgi:predicted GH43/DUF377 family glycosyl hydrolase